MENKISKEELQEQLYVIENKEKELKDSILCETYSNMTFIQIWKKCNNWKKVITYSIIGSIVVGMLCYDTIFLISIPPVLFLLSSLSNALEIKMSINYITKNKQIN